MQLFIFKNDVINDANIAIKKKKIKSYIHLITIFIFVVKSITSYKFNLSTLIHIENIFSKTSIIITPPLVYRAISPFLFIYKIIILKTYLIIINLYIRYILLIKFIITRIIIMLFIIFTQNLYKKFHNKKKLIILTSNKIFKFSIKQYATRQKSIAYEFITQL